MSFLKNKYFILSSAGSFFSNLGASSIIATIVFLVVGHFGLEKRYVSIFMVSGMIAAMLVAPAIGRFSDRGLTEQKQMLVWTAIANIIGVLLFYVFDNYWIIVAVNVSLFAIGSSNGFLIMSYAKVQSRMFNEKADDAAMFNRAMVSFAWGVGPAAGGFFVSRFGFDSLYIFIFVANIVTLLIVYVLPSLKISEEAEKTDTLPIKVRPKAILNTKAKILLLAFLLVHIVIAAIAILLPLHVLDLGGNEEQAGQAFAIAALIEIPILLFCSKLLRFLGQMKMLYLIFALAIVSFLLSGATVSLNNFFILQLLSGTMMALVMGIGLTLIQNTMPNNPATIISYYSNMLRLSILIGTGSVGFIADYVPAGDLLMVLSLLPLLALVTISMFKEKLATEPQA